MKKVSMIAVMLLFISLGIYAQRIEAAKVPEPIKAAFAKAFPNASGVTWEMEKGNYEAGFKKDGKVMAALFEPSGIMKESETTIEVASLPASVLTYVKEHYKGKQIKEGAKIVKSTGEINYEAEVDGKDVIFDASGKFLREEAD